MEREPCRPVAATTVLFSGKWKPTILHLKAGLPPLNIASVPGSPQRNRAIPASARLERLVPRKSGMNSEFKMIALIEFMAEMRNLVDTAKRRHDECREREVEPCDQSATDGGEPKKAGDDGLRHCHTLHTPVAAVSRA